MNPENKTSDFERIALAQHVQLEDMNSALTAMSSHLSGLKQTGEKQRSRLAGLDSELDGLLALAGVDVLCADMEEVDASDVLMLSDAEKAAARGNVPDFVFAFLSSDVDTRDWGNYLSEVEKYARDRGIDFGSNPYERLLSVQQRVEIERRLNEEFSSTKPCTCDKWDYVIAASCGVIGGLVDAFFVGLPGQGALGILTDKGADKLVEKFASLSGWKGPKGDSDSTRSAIGFLERKFPVNYDQRHTGDVGDSFAMSASNHHLKSLSHSPSPVGLFFSILNQFTSTSSFVAEGRVVTIDTKDFMLEGNTLLAKLFCGFCNWIGHIISDLAGSSGSKGRGSGVGIPFFELFQFADFGAIGKEKKTVAEMEVSVFENGYDLRHGAAMAIPVAFTELAVRVLFTVKRRYYHKLDWKECLPRGSNPNLRRMLLAAHGTLCLVDVADAAIRSGCQPLIMLPHMNLIGWVRFGFLGLKEASALARLEKLDHEAISRSIDADLRELLASG